MVSNTFHDHTREGLKFSGSCNSNIYGRYGSALVSQNVFKEIGYRALTVQWVSVLTIEDNVFVDNTGTNIVYIELTRSSSEAELLIMHNNTIVDNSADSIVFFNGQFSYGLDNVFFKDNVVANNTCYQALSIRFYANEITGATDMFNISGNTFVTNLPLPAFTREATFIPLAVVSFDKPHVVFTANIIANPFFPIQLIAIGDNFGTHVEAELNWWGTTDELEIQEYIWDGLDKYEFATVNYFPYLLSADLTDVINPNATRLVTPFVSNDVIGGVVHGTVSLTNITYYVDRDIIIPQSSTLYIGAGAVLSFYPFLTMVVHGKLIAEGTIDHKISFEPHVFTSNDTLNSTTIRLVDGSSEREGRLELLINMQWHSVCSNYWTKQNALVACRQMGYFDVENFNFHPRQPGTGPILNYPVKCKGNEIDLLECEPNEDGTAWCTSHSYDVNIQCRHHQWAGLFFPANNKVSTLRHVRIEHAGYNYRHDTNVIYSTKSINIHLYHHDFHDLDFVSPSTGMKLLYVNPFHPIRPLSDVSMKDCSTSGYAFESYSNGVYLENWDLNDCYGTYSTQQINLYTELVKFVEPSNKMSTCVWNTTLDSEDIFILSPPISGSRSCYGIFTISNNDFNGRIGVLVLYSSAYAITEVEDQGEIILRVDGDTPHENSVVSNSSIITIRHQSSNYRYDYLFYIVVQGVKGKLGTDSLFGML